MLLALTILLTSTSGCQTVPSEVVCPALPEYSLGMQRQAAEELKMLPADGMVRGRMMPDYGRMRDEVRACRGS